MNFHLDVGRIPQKYPLRLNFYDNPPDEDITLEDFEEFAISRLHILSEIETAQVRNISGKEYELLLKKKCEAYIPLGSTERGQAICDEERRKDHISHYVLRLAFCRSEELRRRFIQAEVRLFRYRFLVSDAKERGEFISSRNFDWEGLSYEESHDSVLMEDLEKLHPSNNVWYKVRWTRVPSLIEKRQVYIKNGWTYVPEKEQSSIIFQEFQSSLEEALEKTAKALPRLDEDARLFPVLKHLGQGFMSGMGVTSEYATADGLADGEEIKADMVDDLAKKHWPLCMRLLHDNLRRDRHLKHYGRLQYGLFLKVVGLSIDEAIIFWRKAFGGKITDDKFNKEYKYNIRHSYGLEGKRTNYPAYSCQRIITQNQPGPQDCHGCPYRHFSSDRLQTALLSTHSELTTNDMPEILSAVKQNAFHVACTRVFELTHGLKRGQGIDRENVTHPNQYAAKSRDILKGKAETSGSGPGIKKEETMDTS